MSTIELRLDDQVAERVKKLAEARHCTVEELITEMIEHLDVANAEKDPLLGRFSDEPAVVDQVVASAMRSREKNPLWQARG